MLNSMFSSCDYMQNKEAPEWTAKRNIY